MRRLGGLLVLLAALLPALPATAEAPCHTWVPGSESLQAAVLSNECVELGPGVYSLDRELGIPGGHTLRGRPGAARSSVVLRADRARPWTQYAGVVVSRGPWSRPSALTGLTVDGNSQDSHRLQGSDRPDGAVIGINAPSMVIHDVDVRNARCIGITSYDGRVAGHAFTTVVSESTVESNGFECSSQAAPPGTGIYVHPVDGPTDRVMLNDNIIRGNDGSGIDIDEVNNGILTGNTLDGNGVVDGFAAISLVDSSNWTISGNRVTQRNVRGKRNCPGGPRGEGSAALFVCAMTRAVTGNDISGNVLSSFYAVLVNRVHGLAAGNVVRDNLVATLGGVRCAEGNPRGANTWEGNNCTTGTVPGVANEPPVYFLPPFAG